MTTTITSPYPVDSATRTCCGGVGGHAENCRPLLFERNRYERLTQGVKVLAEDENVASAEAPYNSEGLQAFVQLHR